MEEIHVHRGFDDLSVAEKESFFFSKYPTGNLLKNNILEFGGEEIVWNSSEPYLDLLVSRGQSFRLNHKFLKSQTNDSNINIAKLYLDKKVKICIGYALLNKQWRKHCWGYNDCKLIETTKLFDAYYGVILTEKNSTKFVEEKLGV